MATRIYDRPRYTDNGNPRITDSDASRTSQDGLIYDLTSPPLLSEAVSLDKTVNIEERQFFTSSDLVTTPDLDIASFHFIYYFSSESVTCDSATIGNVDLVELQLFSTTSVDSGAVEFDANPVLEQIHIYSIDSVNTESTELGSDTLFQHHQFTQRNLTAQPPPLPQVSLTEKQLFTTVDDITTSSVIVPVASFTYIYTWAMYNVETDDVVIGTTPISQQHNVATSDISASSDLSTSSLEEKHLLTTADLSSTSPALDTPQFIYTVKDCFSGPVEVDIAQITQIHQQSPLDVIAESSFVGVTSIQQIHQWQSDAALTNGSVLDYPDLEEVHGFTSSSVYSGTGNLSVPDLEEKHLFTTPEFTAQSHLETTDLEEKHLFTTQPVNTDESIVRTPAEFTHIYVFESDSIATDSPVLDIGDWKYELVYHEALVILETELDKRPLLFPGSIYDKRRVRLPVTIYARRDM